MYNLCYAVARLKLKDTIDEDDVKEVIEFYNKQLKYWSQIKADIPSDPRDLAYHEMVKKLTRQKFKCEFEQLYARIMSMLISIRRNLMRKRVNAFGISRIISMLDIFMINLLKDREMREF